jgi:ABC-2 type transport system permease protein
MSTALRTMPTLQRPSSLRIFLTEMRYQILGSLRTRAFSLSAIGFPVMFYILFGLVMNRNETISAGVSVAKYLLGGYAVFGSLGAAIFGIGIGVAVDRSAGCWASHSATSPSRSLSSPTSPSMLRRVPCRSPAWVWRWPSSSRPTRRVASPTSSICR